MPTGTCLNWVTTSITASQTETYCPAPLLVFEGYGALILINLLFDAI